MVEEFFDTDIGKFKIMNHPTKSSLIFVQTHLPVTPEGVWEDLGWMKKKEFFKMIKPHNPKELIIPSYSSYSNKAKESPISTTKIQETPPEITIETAIQSTEPLTKVSKKGLVMVPVLTKKLSSTEKFTVEAVRILDLCDGKHSVHDICQETKYPILKVNQIIKEYQKKNWIEVTRLIKT